MNRQLTAVSIAALFAMTMAGLVVAADLPKEDSAAAADKIKAELLRPGGWKVNWSLLDDKGVSMIVFEARGEKIVATVRNLTTHVTCEREVTITAGTVKLDGCHDWGITLRFDPADQASPLKGKSSGKGYEYTFQPAGD